MHQSIMQIRQQQQSAMKALSTMMSELQIQIAAVVTPFLKQIQSQCTTAHAVPTHTIQYKWYFQLTNFYTEHTEFFILI